MADMFFRRQLRLRKHSVMVHLLSKEYSLTYGHNCL